MPAEVYAFVSTKGGAGKTTLATATALGLASRGRRVGVFDLDLIGTSIGDGLPLCAPDIAGPDGALDLTSAPERWLSRPATLQARARRAASHTHDIWLPYLNDALLFTSDRGQLDLRAAVWRRAEGDAVCWFPSSPCLHDVSVAAAWFERPDFDKLGRRFAWLAREAAQRLALDALVLDLPPGITWFSDLFLRHLQAGSDTLAPVQPVFVTTPDRNDLYPSAEYFARAVLSWPRMRFVLNRDRQRLGAIREELRQTFDLLLGPARAEERLRAISLHSDTLGRLFVSDRAELPQAVLDEVLLTLEIP